MVVTVHRNDVCHLAADYPVRWEVASFGPRPGRTVEHPSGNVTVIALPVAVQVHVPAGSKVVNGRLYGHFALKLGIDAMSVLYKARKEADGFFVLPPVAC